jgi:hypothetical protein
MPEDFEVTTVSATDLLSAEELSQMAKYSSPNKQPVAAPNSAQAGQGEADQAQSDHADHEEADIEGIQNPLADPDSALIEAEDAATLDLDNGPSAFLVSSWMVTKQKSNLAWKGTLQPALIQAKENAIKFKEEKAEPKISEWHEKTKAGLSSVDTYLKETVQVRRIRTVQPHTTRIRTPCAPLITHTSQVTHSHPSLTLAPHVTHSRTPRHSLSHPSPLSPSRRSVQG